MKTQAATQARHPGGRGMVRNKLFQRAHPQRLIALLQGGKGLNQLHRFVVIERDIANALYS
jgi:hypothetical protein